ncbi:MAG: peptidoglycan D,D-transpeptidase FtsI family protein [Dehalococcoidia bacterium]
MLFPNRFERTASLAGAAGLAFVFVVLAVLGYWQVARGDLAQNDLNPRVLERFSNPSRGRILAADGTVLAESLPGGERVYRDASIAHVLGYIDPRYGSQGIELTRNGALSGEEPVGWDGALNAEFERAPPAGRDVRLTIDSRVQEAGAQALGTRKGAVVAIDPVTGDILAMVSVPTYDPGALASEGGESLLSDPAAPLLNRSTHGLYPPGSTFKTVTAASALEFNVITPSTIVECPGEIVIEGFPISCSNVPQGVGRYPFSDAYIYSVNAIFADVGANVLGWNRLEDTAQRLGFGRPIDFELTTAISELRLPGSPRTNVLLASTAFGQGELLVTPLQMALVAAAVANGGEMARPRIVAGEAGASGEFSAPADPRLTRVLSAETAGTVAAMMREVVARGLVSGMSNLGFEAGGKTGTAETGTGGQSHAWFIAFGSRGGKQAAVAVIVENGGRGGEVAAPIAASVLKAALLP